MITFYYVLDFLAFSWIFWPLLGFLFFWPFVVLMHCIADDESEKTLFYPIFPFLIAFSLFFYHFPHIRPNFLIWQTYVYGVGGYVLAGFLVSLYKWFMKLHDFRKMDKDGLWKEISSSLSNRYGCKEMTPEEVKEELITQIKRNKLKGSFYEPPYSKYKVDLDQNDQLRIYPNWKKYPLSMWWTYWPFYMFEVVLDPIRRFINSVVDLLKEFYNKIAQHFSVKI